MAFKVKKSFTFFGYGLQVKKGDTASRRVGGLFQSKDLALAYALRFHPGHKAHIFGIRLESTPIDSPSSR
jgi:hypothetical protein